jgi:hypothetical protein
MTQETALFVRVGPARQALVAELARRADVALRRARKQLPGERSESVRYEALSAAIERCALEALWAGEPHLEATPDGASPAGSKVLLGGQIIPDSAPVDVHRWLADGHTVVELRLPHARGETPMEGEAGLGPPPVLARWRSEALAPGAAMGERFKDQLERAVNQPGAPDAVIRPSRITNSVLTETLRRYAAADGESGVLETPVVYQDGSRGPSFPLRSVRLTETKPAGWRELRFTLLSIRHVEMDLAVDGAWLRNARVSQPRPAGLTDELVYTTSLQQLEAVSQDGPVLIFMHQTGLETAVVGFYRAVLRHLMRAPGSVVVMPCYFRGAGRFEEGTPWMTV